MEIPWFGVVVAVIVALVAVAWFCIINTNTPYAGVTDRIFIQNYYVDSKVTPGDTLHANMTIYSEQDNNITLKADVYFHTPLGLLHIKSFNRSVDFSGSLSENFSADIPTTYQGMDTSGTYTVEVELYKDGTNIDGFSQEVLIGY